MRWRCDGGPRDGSGDAPQPGLSPGVTLGDPRRPPQGGGTVPAALPARGRATPPSGDASGAAACSAVYGRCPTSCAGARAGGSTCQRVAGSMRDSRAGRTTRCCCSVRASLCRQPRCIPFRFRRPRAGCSPPIRRPKTSRPRLNACPPWCLDPSLIMSIHSVDSSARTGGNCRDDLLSGPAHRLRESAPRIPGRGVAIVAACPTLRRPSGSGPGRTRCGAWWATPWP
jgi:hypothetical protein